MRILLVEDHAATARAFQWLLSHRGHQVTIAGTLADARRRCDEGTFDLMLCDLGLPDGNGLDMADVACHCGVPAVAITGLDRAALGTRADAFWRFLTKPVALNQVLDVVAEAEALAERAPPPT